MRKKHGAAQAAFLHGRCTDSGSDEGSVSRLLSSEMRVVEIVRRPVELGDVAFSRPEEEWIEYGPVDDRRRVGFHDYGELYAVPGLYDHVFGDLLGLRTAQTVVALYGDALLRLDRPAGGERALDLGAGNGVGGELLAGIGIARVIGLDIEPAARDAAERDRPGVYADYLIGDLDADPSLWTALRREGLTSVLALSSVGVDAISCQLLTRVIAEALTSDGVVAFAIADEIATGFLNELCRSLPLELIGTRRYVHRRRTDGSDHRATAVVARLGIGGTG